MDHILSVNRVPLAGNQVPLIMLSAQFEGHSMKDLANIIKRDKSGILRGLRSLEKRGLIRFQGETNDKRKRLVYLTPVGHDLVEQIINSIDTAEKQIKNGISTSEISSFYKILDRINANCLKITGKTEDDFNFKRHLKGIMTKHS
jgi:DNA-binding MarR family transcriptional regulator